MTLYTEELVQALDEERRARRPEPRARHARPRRRTRLATALRHLANRIEAEPIKPRQVSL